MKLMVLGGGNCQLNLIKRAKSLGHYVIVVDYLPQCPAKNIADVHLLISTFDTPSVVKAAKDYCIDGIVTIGTDQPVLTAAITSEKLGLPFYINSDTAKAVTNKQIMKKLFCENDIPNVNYRLIKENFNDNELDDICFPAVLKPVDSQGQRGIFRVNSIAEVRENIGETLHYSRENKALLEEYYENDEITVNGWVDNGMVTIISVVDRVTIKQSNHIGICLCHNFPSVHLEKNYDEIESVTKRIVSSFGIKNGPIYFQYLIGSEGLKVNEIAMRIGGAYEDITIPLLSGIDILGMLLEYVQRGGCDTAKLCDYSLKRNNKSLSTQMFFCNPGKVRYITPKEEIMQLSGVHDVYYAIDENSVIPNIENATARAGYIIIEGNSFCNMIDNVNNVFERLQVLDEKDHNLVIKYTDYENKYVFDSPK